jgi:hypothetical protein
VDQARRRVQQLWPRFQGFRRYAAAAGFWRSLGTTVEQGYFRAPFREPFSGKRSCRTGADYQNVKLFHVNER